VVLRPDLDGGMDGASGGFSTIGLSCASTHADPPDLGLDRRVAVGLLELLLELGDRHFLPLVRLPVLNR
jgi:hypothetical protein